MTEKKWIFTPHDAGAIEEVAKRCGVSPVVAQLLVQRGLSEPDAVKSFLTAKLTDLRPPEELPGLNDAVDVISSFVEQGKDIVIHGDYDADGMTATAILFRCLKLLAARVTYHLPNRMEEGYGLHVETVEKLAARGKQLIITVDCGVASVEAAQKARELGVSLVITDHHRFGNELPDADALVHPALPGSNYPFAGLCGAGVAFKLAWALCQRNSGATKVSESQRAFLLQAVGLAAIGTVADVVPLVDENRVIVKNGLKTLHKNPPLGLRRLMEANRLFEKQQLGSEDIGFTIGPRLNAAGRLGQAQLGVELLVTEDPERADALAKYIDELNNSRNKIERSIHISAAKQLKEVHSVEDDPAFVLASPSWHPGVIGIVAGKLAEKYHRPVVMIALDKLGSKPGTGSGRSPNGVNLHQAFLECSDLLLSGGGHAAAAGCRIEETSLRAFRSAFLEAVAEQSAELSTEHRVEVDAEATLSQLNLATVSQIEQLAPFGMENPRPLFYATGLSLPDAPKAMGATGRHLSAQLSQHGKKTRAVAFGQAEDWLGELSAVEGTIDVAFRPVINEFNGYRSVEMHLVDWRVTKQAKIPAPHLDRELSPQQTK